MKPAQRKDHRRLVRATKSSAHDPVAVKKVGIQTCSAHKGVREKDVRLVAISVLEHLPHDEHREKVEARLAKVATRKLREPPHDI